MSVRVAPGRRSRVRQLARRTSSILGSQWAIQMRCRIPTRWSTARSGSSPSSGFRVGGAARSSGSSSTSRSTAASGRRSRRSLTKSPLGSMTTTPRPWAMSCRARLAIRVDLPDPVAPSRWTWWQASAAVSRTGWAGPSSGSPRTLPSSGSPGGGGTGRAPARTSPGTAGSAGRCAKAASSPVASRSPASRGRPVRVRVGRHNRWRDSRLRPA